ncbi:MAG TPA: UrcA family protein [Allosphingosinicella sp.]|nr:UrcA family protein [Allosphingosinicella sp.]
MTRNLARIALAFAAALAALAPAAAPAQAGGGQYAVRVQSDDLNLASRSGQATLADRIGAAADKLCGYAGTVSLREFIASADCRAAFEKAAHGRANAVLAANGRGSSLTAASR